VRLDRLGAGDATVEDMKDALLILFAAIVAGLGILVYYQDDSPGPISATPFYSVQGEAAREASTGNDIQIWCQSERLAARAYAAGVWDQSARTDFTLSLQKGYGVIDDAVVLREKEALVGYCAPAGLTLGRVTDVYCKFLEDNPEKRSATAASLFTEAMRRTWPCN
jgi:Rap1a immunity proteins